MLRLLRAADHRTVVAAVLSVAVLVGLFWLAEPLLRPLGNLNLVIFFVGVVSWR